MLAPASAQHDTFAANRATGCVSLSARPLNGRTRRGRVYEDGSLRVRFPNVTDAALEAVLVNTAGGMTGGDRFAIDMNLEPDAHLLAGTAAAEKIYRTTGPDTELTVSLTLGEAAQLEWLPQETILFNGARLSRRIGVELADTASVLICEPVVFGRCAMGETVEDGAITDRWQVRRGGKLIFAETLRLSGGIARNLAQPAIAGGDAAIATMFIAPAADQIAEKLRALAPFAGETGVSAWKGFALVRLCARDGAALRMDIVRILAALGRAVPRLWLG
jgi:urease accessory protein